MVDTNKDAYVTEWPFTLPHDRRAQMSFAILGQLTLNDYFTKPFRWLLRDCKHDLSAIIEKVEQHSGERLPSIVEFHRGMERCANLAGRHVTVQWLLETDAHEWGPGNSNELYEALVELDNLGTAVSVIRVPSSLKADIRAMFSVTEVNLLYHIGGMRLRDFYCKFENQQDYERAYTEDERKLFDKMREFKLLSCHESGLACGQAENVESANLEAVIPLPAG